jgi:3-hydroxyacyl-CoA dehydrogenase
MGIRVEEADALCGKVMGRMRTAIFATADAVGLDTVQHVATTIHDNAQNDERIETFVLPQYVETMISNNWLGNKTGGGFFKRGKDAGGNVTQLALDLDALVYRDQVEPDYPCLHAAEQVVAQAAKVRAVVYGNDPGALFAWDILISDLAYAVNRVGEIADNIVDIDNTMKWGYAWRLGPFECWDAIGLRQSVERMEKEGRIVPARVTRMLDEGNESFYISVDGIERYFDFSSNSYLPKTT